MTLLWIIFWLFGQIRTRISAETRLMIDGSHTKRFRRVFFVALQGTIPSGFTGIWAHNWAVKNCMLSVRQPAHLMASDWAAFKNQIRQILQQGCSYHIENQIKISYKKADMILTVQGKSRLLKFFTYWNWLKTERISVPDRDSNKHNAFLQFCLADV